jgi:hypothetical protein
VSDNFLIKIAFIPSSNFMDSFTNDIKIAADSKFSFMSQFKDTWNSVKDIQDVTTWEGISYNNPIIGEVIILSPIAINAWGPKIKYWIGGFMILMTVVLTFRRIGGVIGGNLH